MAVNELLHELGAKTGLGNLALDENGVCQLVFDGELTIEIEAPPNSASFWIVATVAQVPPTEDTAFFRELLAANFMGRGTTGQALAVDSKRGEIVLCQRLDIARSDYALLEREVEAFLNALDAWKEKIGHGEVAASEPDTLTAGLHFIRG